LGWSLDDKTEHFSRQELIEKFSIERVVKSPASFDPKKLQAFEDWHFQQLSPEQKIALATPFLEKAGLVQSPITADQRQIAEKVIAAAGDRIKVAGDILAFDDFFRADDQLAYDESSFDKHIRKADAVALLGRFRDCLATTEPFDVPTLEATMQQFIAAEVIKINHIIHAVRVAVTGKSVGLGLFDTLAILGRDRVLGRIERAMARS